MQPAHLPVLTGGRKRSGVRRGAARPNGVAFGYGLYVLAIGATLVLLVTIAVIGRLLPGDLGPEQEG